MEIARGSNVRLLITVFANFRWRNQSKSVAIDEKRKKHIAPSLICTKALSESDKPQSFTLFVPPDFLISEAPLCLIFSSAGCGQLTLTAFKGNNSLHFLLCPVSYSDLEILFPSWSVELL
eukprot:TRINITY_DN40263_c0_g1_i1.p1 TRINITY_DN40263_c0_g1~~TRINITY_DN40263_c0_g1_i1.p1  ORF type:complete len:120 (-),score=5.92 TRINITY_DN40263_c0_g1_i1:115-474(-)